METNRLKQFYVLSKIQNLRESAEILRISHSGLSKSLKVLEGELGVILFVPKGRGIQITDQGKELADKLPVFFNELEFLFTNKKNNIKPTCRIGTFEVFSTYFINHLESLIDTHNMELYELLPGNLEKALKEHKIDIGITYEPIPIKGIEYLKIRSIETGVYSCNRKFKKMSFEKIPFAAPLNPIDSVPTGVKGLDGWPENKFPRNIEFKVDMMESAIQLARMGKCAVFIPRFVAKLHNIYTTKEFQLNEIPLPVRMKPVIHPVYLVKRVSQEEDKLFKTVAKYIRRL